MGRCPTSAPHFFAHVSGEVTRMLCLCAPAGQEDFFREMGTPAATRTEPAPKMNDKAMKAFAAKTKARAGLPDRFLPLE